MKRAQQVAIKDHIKILQKRNSYNGKQKEYINKLTDQVIQRQHNETEISNNPRSREKSAYKDDKEYTEDAQVAAILKNKDRLEKFREMVIMHVKKNDISTQILSKDLEDIVLPANSFKQCLNVIGIQLSP